MLKLRTFKTILEHNSVSRSDGLEVMVGNKRQFGHAEATSKFSSVFYFLGDFFSFQLFQPLIV